MHYRKRKRKDGRTVYDFAIHRGNKYLSKTFTDKKIGERWLREHEKSFEETGLPSGLEERKKHTVGEIYQKYLNEIKRGESDKVAINTLLKHRICKLTIAEWQKKHCYEYRTDRLNSVFYPKGASVGVPVTARTVEREEHTLQRVFNHAIDRQWDGCAGLKKGQDNPWAQMEPIEGSSHERDRTLRDGELERLTKAAEHCRGLNKQYMPLVIQFSMCTGLRLQEIFNLTWEDCNRGTRLIRIKKHKTSKKHKRPERYLITPFWVEYLLEQLSILSKPKHKTDKVFQHWSGKACQQSWRDVTKRAGIPGKRVAYTLPDGPYRLELYYKQMKENNGRIIQEDIIIEPDGVGLEINRDLRREAGSMFAAAGLTSPEHDLMMGHSNKIQSIYIEPTPDVVKAIADKLDRHMLDATRDEIFAMARENAATRKENETQEKPDNVVQLSPLMTERWKKWLQQQRSK